MSVYNIYDCTQYIIIVILITYMHALYICYREDLVRQTEAILHFNGCGDTTTREDLKVTITIPPLLVYNDGKCT